MSVIVCERAEPPDVPAIDALGRQAGLAVDGQSSLAQPHALLWVARSGPGREVMGFIVIWQLGDTWEVIDLATELRRRRQGVASSLLATVTREAAGFGIRAVLLEVRAGNHAAIALYEKHGFCVFSERKDYYRAPVENALCLRLTLPAPPLGTA